MLDSGYFRMLKSCASRYFSFFLSCSSFFCFYSLSSASLHHIVSPSQYQHDKVARQRSEFFRNTKSSLCSAQNNQLKLKVKWIICEVSKRSSPKRAGLWNSTATKSKWLGTFDELHPTRMKMEISKQLSSLSLLSQSLSFLMTMHTRVKSLKRRRRWSFCHRWREKVARLLSLNHNEPSRREQSQLSLIAGKWIRWAKTLTKDFPPSNCQTINSRISSVALSRQLTRTQSTH